MAVAALLPAIAFVVVNPSAANVETGDNAQAFNTLCGFLALQQAAAPSAAEFPAASEAYDAIQRLNATLSDDEWQKMFTKDGDGKTWLDNPPTTAPAANNWKDRWTDWRKAMQQAADTNKKKEIKDAGFAELTGNLRRKTQAAVRRLAEAAKLIKEQLDNLPETKTDFTTFAKKQLNKALYNANNDDEPQQTAAAVFAKPAGNNYAGACTGTVEANKAVSVAAVITCICAKDNSAAAGEACGRKIENSGNWDTAAAGPANTDVTNLLKFCAPSGAAQLTASLIYSQLIAAASQFKAGAGSSGYLGSSENGSCDGKNTGGLCVSYSDYKTGTSSKFYTLPWVAPLHQLANKLRQREDSAIKGELLTQHLQKLKVEAFQTANEMQLSHIELPRDNKEANNDNTIKEKQQECEQHKDNKKACTEENNCIWEGGESDKGECKVNTTQITEQAKQAPTGAAGGEDPNCGQYKDPDTCAKAPGKPKEGKKSVCGWIENKCQDSSILVSKQFALSVVSAAFVAMLF
uniref:Variant surface glycoprotein n=1 Tax=Trypanosoma brucei TaxID=5691 RepID=A0A1V0FXT4_9TRYP|nr:variant surface glycoprotein [Trypanosoma brucei]